MNEEPGAVLISRPVSAYPEAIWLNPVPEAQWSHTHSIETVRALIGACRFPSTLEGLDAGMRQLSR